MANPKKTQPSFDQINASWALEGHVMDAVDLENQRRIVSGEATIEQVIEELRREYLITPRERFKTRIDARYEQLEESSPRRSRTLIR